MTDINELDVHDVGLKGIFGDRFYDATEAPVRAEPTKATTNPTGDETPNPGSTRKPREIKYEPEKEPCFIDSLKQCAKYLLFFGSLNLLLFYWNETGQMADSAAIPSMLVCMALAGWNVGRVIGGKI